METLSQILSPDFLLRNSVYTSVLVGFACPLVGVFLVMRRLVFMGVALPQISSTGVAIALSFPLWFGFQLHDHGAHSAHALAFAGSMTFSLAAILVLAFMERRGRGQPEGRLGTAYVVAASLSILLLAKNPYGEIGWLDLLKGEVITVSNFDLVLTAATLLVVLAALGLFHKELLLVSFDREMAITLRKNVVFWDVAALFADRPDRLDGSAQCRPPDRLRIFANSRPDGAPVRPQYTPVHDAGLLDRRRGRISRLLGRLSSRFARRPDGCRPARCALRHSLAYLQASARRGRRIWGGVVSGWAVRVRSWLDRKKRGI